MFYMLFVVRQFIINTANGTLRAQHHAKDDNLGSAAAEAQQLLSLQPAKTDAMRLRAMSHQRILLRELRPGYAYAPSFLCEGCQNVFRVRTVLQRDVRRLCLIVYDVQEHTGLEASLDR